MASSKKRAAGESEDRREIQKKNKKQKQNAASLPPHSSSDKIGGEIKVAGTEDAQKMPSNEASDTNDRSASVEKRGREGSGQRFIVFIGNLPYTATDSSIAAHFVKVKPTQVRHRIQKGTAKSKGFAFLEFSAYDRMKTCLKLYHHSLFDDGISPPRKINVELTAGGGGSSIGRKTKIRTKNDKLYRERQTRALEAKKTKSPHDSESKNRKENNDMASSTTLNQTEDSVHPSRRARITSRG